MRLTVFDHEHHAFASRYTRPNGAATYSRDIVEHHIPVWREVLESLGVRSATIGTAAKMRHDTPGGELAIQYLHEYRRLRPVDNLIHLHERLKSDHDRVVFVTAYRTAVGWLEDAGIPAMFVPMTIDVAKVSAHRNDHVEPRTAIWFGNIVNEKTRTTYHLVRNALLEHGYAVNRISHGKFNGSEGLTQEEAWRRVSEHEVGVGVGRCALEMMALGMKVLIAGTGFAGIVTTPEELQAQTGTDFNSYITTFDRDPGHCIDNLHRVLTGPVNDIPVALDVIRSFR